MPNLFLHVVNSEFTSRDDGADFDAPDLALAHGVDSAVAIAADEIRAGRSSTAIQVSVEEQDGSVLLRSVVSLSVAPLMLPA